MTDIALDVGSRASTAELKKVPDKWLSRCVGDAENFLATAFGKAPYLSQGDSGRFDGLLSRAELNRLLTLGTIPAIKVRLVDNDRPVSAWEWAREENSSVLPDGRKIERLIGDGCTLVINEIDRFSYGLFAFCGGLQTELSYRVGANIYLTPPHAQGFSIHCDDHDVIVLQLAGEKDWQVYDRTAEEPRQTEHVTLPADQRPMIATKLRKGDALYIPRGFPHCAAAADQSSLHASIGVYPVTVADVLDYLINELADSPGLAQPLKPGFAYRPDDIEALLTPSGQALRQRLDDPATTDELARAFCQTWIKTRVRGLPRRTA